MLNGVALGTFDGMHNGHRAVIDAIKDYNRIAVTFKRPPKTYLGAKQQLLMTPEDKYQSLLDYGVNEVFMPEFTEIRDVSPLDFLEMIREKYKPKAISCGFNYRFGKNAEGNTEFIAEFCQKNGIEFKCVPAVKYNGEAISSSKIRAMITDGNVEEANTLIFGGFGFSAEVIHGDHRGRTIGFPTVNQIYPVCLVELKFGVYAVEIEIGSQKFRAITNIGYRPTFKTPIVTAETYIPHFTGDLYGKRLRVNLLKFLREEHKFDSLDNLKTAIKCDVSSLLGK
ncbi:MAG: riboflavin biosynthesis protein RibF [Ruminococcaceae bacterium]|nr:riboflavin biosynthesis protein RibF [Oscillospiraceae bacterium]